MSENFKNNRFANASQRPFTNQERDNADSFMATLGYKSSWVKEGATPEMVEFADKAGKFMADNGLTNSKIRSIYSEIKRIQMVTFDNEKASFYLLKPKVAYALARDKHNVGLKLFKLVFDKCFSDISDQKNYHNFCNLIEAVLAYHKAHDGRD
jgi:CRISPR-associated protein Csm2